MHDVLTKNGFFCPFCGASFNDKNGKPPPLILANIPLIRLFDKELIKVENKLTPEEKQQLKEQEAEKILKEKAIEMYKDIVKAQKD